MTTTTDTGKEASGALRGIRVLDFGQYIPGPLLGMLLSDQGANVIKIERPGGDPARDRDAFATWNRGKRSIVLDLKNTQGRRRAQALAETADVVIENFRPLTAGKLGIGYRQLAATNPGLIYCSLPGFGEESPYRDRKGWEPIVGAVTGAHQQIEGTTEPLFLPLPAASTFAAILGAGSVAMALIARHQTGVGQYIEVPLHSAMFPAIGGRLVQLHDMETEDLFEMPRMIMARQYQCSDGRWVQNHGMYARFVSQFLQAAGHPEWIEEVVAEYGRHVDPETGQMWLERFKKLFLERTAKEWEDAINAKGGACTVCKTVDEWLVHEHAVEAKMVVEVDDAKLGLMKQPGVQVRLRGTPGAIQGRAPTLGEHTDQVMAELRTATKPAPAPPANGQQDILAALQGVRVLDLCIVLAGPTCGRTLGDFGADVIKIDDPARPYDISGSLDVNRGKRSILLDLKSDRGREVFWKLVETADVVVENHRNGAFDRLGLGYEDVKKRRPDIVYASLNAFGYDGPWSQRAGWEQLAQATSGIQVRRGGRDGTPTLLPYALNDYGTGLLGAYAVALALHEKNRTGQGQSVDSGLALTAGLLQSPYFLDYEGFQRDEPEGFDVRGHSALSRLYPTSSGWMYLHCNDERSWNGLTALREFASLASDSRFATAEGRKDSDAELTAGLNGIFPSKSTQEWVDLLASKNVSAIENLAPADFRDDSHVREAGLVVTRDHPGRGSADHVGVAPRLSKTPVRLGVPAPLLGADTREILQETGYSAAEIKSLMSAGVVATAPR